MFETFTVHDTANEDFASGFGFGSAVCSYLCHFRGEKEKCSSMLDAIVTIEGKDGLVKDWRLIG